MVFFECFPQSPHLSHMSPPINGSLVSDRIVVVSFTPYLSLCGISKRKLVSVLSLDKSVVAAVARKLEIAPDVRHKEKEHNEIAN